MPSIYEIEQYEICVTKYRVEASSEADATLAITAIETAVIQGMLFAYNTELRKSGFAEPYGLKTWGMEAGLKYFDETIAGVQQGITQAGKSTVARPAVVLKKMP